MLQIDTPEDFVLATNETHTVREFVEKAFAHLGTIVKWLGETGTIEEIGVDDNDHSKVYVRIDPKYFRPTEVDLLLGDATKAKEKLGWAPKILFEDLVKEMVTADLVAVDGGKDEY
jgi:GDPmannose 4,6-dehydratase